MNGIGRFAPLAGAVILGGATFGIAWVLMNPTPSETTAPEESAPPTPAEPSAPTDASTKPSAPRSGGSLILEAKGGPPTNGNLTPFGSGVGGNRATHEMSGPWEKLSGYGLPNPRRLTDPEKAALNVLGAAADIHKYKFSRNVLEDGSTVPGVPPLDGGEVKKRFLDKVAAKGLGQGLEEFVRDIAIQSPDYIDLKVTREVSWTELQKILGAVKQTSGPDAASKSVMTWYNTGKVDSGDWLSFGVSAGQVREVRVSFPTLYFAKGALPEDCPLIPAEWVPGGRSPPDPSKAMKKQKPRAPDAGPREVEVLEKLGVVRDVKVVRFSAPRPNATADDVAQEAVGKALAPDLLATARKFRTGQATHLVVTPSKPMSLDEMTDIMGDTPSRTDDSQTFPGTSVRWYHYNWIEIGVVEGQVKKVRISCSAIPAKL